MFIDTVEILVKAGSGGNGAVSFRHNEGKVKGGPDGGNGGRGGDVYIQGTSDTTALQQFTYKKEAKAEDGVKGSRKNLFGKNGADAVILVPIGTEVRNLDTDEVFEILDTTEKHLLAQGGKGGLGNNEFKSATNQAPRYATDGEKGEEKRIRLTLRLIADIGLIGLPNAGKSSLLEVLTNAHPKIGNYPFTTLEPNLGVMDHIILADIPGLIEGASDGKGLGIQFLRHIEKTKILVHCIDATLSDPVVVYKTVRSEFAAYNTELTKKRELVFLTKKDMVTDEEIAKRVKALKKVARNILPVSVIDDESITAVKKLLRKEVAK